MLWVKSFYKTVTDKRVLLASLPFTLVAGGILTSFIAASSYNSDELNYQWPRVKASQGQAAPSDSVDLFYSGAYRILDAWTFSPDAQSVRQLISNGDLVSQPETVGRSIWDLAPGRTVELKPVSLEFCQHFNHGNPPATPQDAIGVSGCYRNLDNQFVAYYREGEPYLQRSQYQVIAGIVETSGDIVRLRIQREGTVYNNCPEDAVNPTGSYYKHHIEPFRVCVPVGEKGAASEVIDILYPGDHWQQSFRDSFKQVHVGVFYEAQ